MVLLPRLRSRLALLLLLSATAARAVGVAEQVEAIEDRYGNTPKQALELLAPLQTPARLAGGRDLAIFLGAWGYAHGVLNKLSVADAAIAELKDIGEREHEPSALALAYALKANMLQFAGQLPAAARWISQAVPLARQSDSAALRYWVMMSAGDLAAALGQAKPALAHFRAAQDAAQAQRNPRRQAQAVIAATPVLMVAGRPADAIAQAELALQLARQAKQPNLELAAHVLQGLAAELAGQPQRQQAATSAARLLAQSLDAKAWQEAARGVNAQAGGPLWYASDMAARLDLATMMLGTGQYEAALQQAARVELAAHAQRDRAASATAAIVHGMAQLGQGLREPGVELADVGIAQLRALPNARSELLVWLHRYADLLDRSGLENQALSRTREALLLEAEQLRSDRIETVVELQRKSSDEENRRQLEALASENALQAAALKRRQSEVLLALALLAVLAGGALLSLWLYLRMRRFNRQLLQHQAELEYAITHDRITGLPNRTQLERDTVAQEGVPDSAYLGIGIQIKRFGLIIGSLGHENGDRLLTQVAERLQQALEPLPGRLYRLDGLSFACVVAGVREDAEAEAILDRLVRAVETPFHVAQQDLLVNLCLGAAMYPRHADKVAAVARLSQLAVRAAREQPGNSYRLFDEAMAEQQRALLRMEARLAQALERGELQLHYQAQRDLSNGALLGFEALLRWNSADGPVSPAVFIPLAEDTGQIIEIGRWVLRQACHQARAWADAGLGQPMVAINVSPRQFQHPGFLDSVREALAESGVAPAQIELEITEGAVMGDAEATIRSLHALRALGLQLAIDDFGTGYASLAYLRRFPLNRLKIDQSFIRPLGSQGEDVAIVEALIHLSHSLGLHVVAEGVELAAQEDCLRRLGCDAMQGYLFARPSPAEAATALLQSYQVPADFLS